jgi:hypothetical protein
MRTDRYCLELTSLKKKLWMRFRFCWGRRLAREGFPVPSPFPPSGQGPSTAISPQREINVPIPPEIKDFRRPPGYRYPAIEIFTTREEAEAERTRRELGIGEPPELMVQKIRHRR